MAKHGNIENMIPPSWSTCPCPTFLCICRYLDAKKIH